MPGRVLVTATNYSTVCKRGKKMLEDRGFEIVENMHGRPLTFEELREVISDVDAVVAGVDTWNEEVYRLAPKLRIIARFGVGVDNIDIKAAKAHGITVTNCKGANSNAVSEHAVALILSAVREIPRLMDGTRKGSWERIVYHEFQNMTIGLYGFGAIAKMVAEKLQPFHARMIAYDPYPDLAAAKQLHVEMVDQDTLFAESDVLSIHVPSIPQTWHAINTDSIARMKDHAYLINTARGAIVDEAALYEALKGGKLAGAAIDVYEKEPAEPGNPLFTLPNFIGTPHTAAETYENYDNCGVITAQAIIDCFDGKIPKNLI